MRRAPLLTLPILMYHKVDIPPPAPGYLPNYVLPVQFEEQLSALAEWGYTTITLDDWDAIRAGKSEPPARPIALTFDDGYRSIYENAWPLLQRYAMTATVFLIADYVGKASTWDKAEPAQPMLGPNEIEEMSAGGVCFGSHTCTHRALTSLSKKDAWEELQRSRTELEAMLGRPVTTLAYPYNKQNRLLRKLARRAGYRLATLGRGRLNARWTNPHALMRIAITSETTVDALKHEINLPSAPARWFVGL